MATYITLIRWTQKGMENIKESPARLDAAKKAFQAVGGEIKDFFLVTGRYDMVMISEAPDHETGVKLALSGAFLRQCLNSEINYTTSRDLIEVKDY